MTSYTSAIDVREQTHAGSVSDDWAGFEAMDAVLGAARAFLETASAEDWLAARRLQADSLDWIRAGG